MTYPRPSWKQRPAPGSRLRIVMFIFSEFLIVAMCLCRLYPVISDLAKTSGFPRIYHMATGDNLPGYGTGYGLVTARKDLPSEQYEQYEADEYYSFLCSFTIEPREPALNNGKPLIVGDTCFAAETGDQRAFIYPLQDSEQAAFAQEKWGRLVFLILGLIVYAGIILIYSLWFITETLSGFPAIRQKR